MKKCMKREVKINNRKNKIKNKKGKNLGWIGQA